MKGERLESWEARRLEGEKGKGIRGWEAGK